MNFNSRFTATHKNNEAQFTNILRQKIDFKNVELSDSSNTTQNALSIFKINSPKNNFEGLR